MSMAEINFGDEAKAITKGISEKKIEILKILEISYE